MNEILSDCFSTLAPQRISELFSSIDKDDMNHFFKKWIKHSNTEDYIAYDVTSISTYSNGIIEDEYDGYNRDHDNLAQINLGMFTPTKTKLPVYYENYNGSLTDKGAIDCILGNAKDVGINSAKLVLDGGFFDKEQINTLVNSGHIFSVGMPLKLDLSKKLFNKHISELYDFKNRTNFTSNYTRVEDYELFGIKGRIVIGLCIESKESMMGTLKEDIVRRENELYAKNKLNSTNGYLVIKIYH